MYSEIPNISTTTYRKENGMYAKYVELRDNKGVNDATVAKATGLPQSVFTDWKNGKSQPKVDKLIKIADFFGITLDALARS